MFNITGPSRLIENSYKKLKPYLLLGFSGCLILYLFYSLFFVKNYSLGVLAFLMPFSFEPIREEIEKLKKIIVKEEEQKFYESLTSINNKIQSATEDRPLFAAVQKRIEELTYPSQVFLFAYKSQDKVYELFPRTQNEAADLLSISEESAFIKQIQKHQKPLLVEENPSLLKEISADQPELHHIVGQYIFPLSGRGWLVGFLTIRLEKSARLSTQKMTWIETLCLQAGIAIESIQQNADLDSFLQERDIVSRIARNVARTTTFENLIDLIFDQTRQWIPVQDFHLLLLDKKSNHLAYNVFTENGIRVKEKENNPLQPIWAADLDVYQNHKALLTDHFYQDWQVRDSIPLPKNLLTWIGVPIRAGSDNIGVISVGRRDTDMVYTQSQFHLLQMIADQTAPGIIRAQQLREAQLRSMQLSTLNDVTRQLTTTLEFEPLLQLILQNAVNIMNCEAGSLLLVDEDSNDLIFRVTTGPVAKNLVGTRLPPGIGAAGKAFDTGQAQVINNVHISSDWYSKTDFQTGFLTRALLACPLLVKSRVIGVIEVLNRQDHLPFSQEDIDLVASFARQAAVILDNAQVFQKTDKNLAARVEELSVMQRIDRELNTTLEFNNTMKITLEWAMRQSHADAGLIGIVEGTAIQISFSQGYIAELDKYTNAHIPLDALSIPEGLHEIRSSKSIEGQDVPSFLLKRARCQVLIPILREDFTIGIIILESTRPSFLSHETEIFLSRLSDHASIAISNAELYREVKNANNAKSEFVSFVAHELKNPMTAVKGYIELLAIGAGGSVTPEQANFLSTIRSNVDRMNTIISDLNDITKIEAGQMRLEIRALSIKDCLDEALHSMRHQINEKKQTLTVSFPPDLPTISADKNRLIQVLINLISNANKYSPANSPIVITGEVASNQWDPEGAGQVLHVRVQDAGVGISEEDQRKIFQKFFRSEDPCNRDIMGTGLGLRITRSLIEMQGGKIWFESALRKGSTFHFTIPITK